MYKIHYEPAEEVEVPVPMAVNFPEEFKFKLGLILLIFWPGRLPKLPMPLPLLLGERSSCSLIILIVSTGSDVDLLYNGWGSGWIFVSKRV